MLIKHVRIWVDCASSSSIAAILTSTNTLGGGWWCTHLVAVLIQLECWGNLHIQLHTQLLVLLVAVELVDFDVGLLFLQLHQQGQHHLAGAAPAGRMTKPLQLIVPC